MNKDIEARNEEIQTRKEEIQERNRDLDELQALFDEQKSELKEAIEQAAILRVGLHEALEALYIPDARS